GVGDTGGGEAAAAAPTPLEIAQAAAQQLASFQAGRASLFSSYGANFMARGGVLIPADATGQAAGTAYFGALGASTGSGGAAAGGDRSVHIEQHYAREPEDPTSWSRSVGADVAATGMF